MSISTQTVLFFLTVSSFSLSSGQSVDEPTPQAVVPGPSYLEPDSSNVQDMNVALLQPNDQVSDDELYAAETDESGELHGLDGWYEPNGLYKPKGLDEPEGLYQLEEPDEVAESNELCGGQGSATIKAKEVEEQRACPNPATNDNPPQKITGAKKKLIPDYEYFGDDHMLEYYREQRVYPHPTAPKLRIYCGGRYAMYCCSRAWNAQDDNDLSEQCEPCRSIMISLPVLKSALRPMTGLIF